MSISMKEVKKEIDEEIEEKKKEKREERYKDVWKEKNENIKWGKMWVEKRYGVD